MTTTLRHKRTEFRLLTRLAAVLWVSFLLGESTSAAQNPNLPSNLEQAPTVGLKRPQAPIDSAITQVPDGFANAPLEPGYLLQLEIYDIPEMSSNLRVDDQGNIRVPLVGPLHVAGKSLPEAEKDIADALVKGDILKAPQVNLNVLQYAPGKVSVLGEVQTPGRISILGPKSLVEVLASAGGETTTAGNDIEIIHNAAGTATSQHIHFPEGASPDLLKSYTVYPGDTVNVKRAGVIYVLGAVNRPGGYVMVDSGTFNVLQAVAVAFGTTPVASTGTVRIIRPHGDGSFDDISVPFTKISKGEAIPVQLQANDILYIPTSTVKSILINGGALSVPQPRLQSIRPRKRS